MGIIRRISLLQYFYTDKRLQADFKQLKQQTQQIEIIKQALHWQRGQRFSARSSTTADTSGWMGQLEIKNNITLWPYLWLGQWLGIGKNASMGFGRYRLE
jgi:sortase (surface protein transpeptidase)